MSLPHLEGFQTMSAQTDLEAEIEGLYSRILDGWNRRDAAGMARFFTDAGSLVGFDGSTVEGRAAIEAHLEPIFEAHPTPPYISLVRDVRRLSPDAALLRAVVGMVPPGESELKPELNAVQTLVATHLEGVWRAELLQTTPAALHGRPEEVEAMTAELQEKLQSS